MSCSKTLDLSPAVSGAHLSYYWTMNEAGDAIKLDSTSFQPWNTVVGSASPPALFSNGIELDTTLFGHGLGGPDSAAFAFDAATSKGVSFWFWYKLLAYKNPGLDSSYTQFFIDCAATVPPNDSQLLLVIAPQLPPAPNTFLRHDDFVTSDTVTVTVTFDPTLSPWHMIAGTLDLVAHTLNLYIDGVLVATAPDAFQFRTSDKGFPLLKNAITGPLPLDVLIDEFGLSLKGALSQAQITALWNGGAGVTWPNITAIVPYP